MSKYYPPVTVTGNPVNFSAPNGGKLDSVSVQIIPTQDLHGYANPWPAGGGKNKIDKSTGLVYSSGYMVFGVANSSDTIPDGSFVLPAGEYTFSLSGDNSTNAESMSVFGADGTRIKIVYNNKILTFTNPSSQALKLSITISSGNFQTWDNYDMQMESGSTATAWEPYSNICPISGLTGLSVYVSPTQDQQDATTYSVDWTTQAGTVYHGTVDHVTGQLTVDWVMYTFDGSEAWTASATPHRFSTNINYLPHPIARQPMTQGATQNVLTSVFGECVYTNADGVGYVVKQSGGNLFVVNEPSATTVNDIKDIVTGMQFCYELATPLTYQLTPKQITALIGQNYIWSSNNGTISVVYALLVPGSDKYTLIVNGVDIADFVERDSYRTTLYPVFSEAVQTLDGVGHTALLRKKGELSARFNPRTAADTAIICAALLNAPCEVQYHCLQRNADVTALMTIDSVSALYLSRCLYCRQKWNDIDSITLTEL